MSLLVSENSLKLNGVICCLSNYFINVSAISSKNNWITKTFHLRVWFVLHFVWIISLLKRCNSPCAPPPPFFSPVSKICILMKYWWSNKCLASLVSLTEPVLPTFLPQRIWPKQIAVLFCYIYSSFTHRWQVLLHISFLFCLFLTTCTLSHGCCSTMLWLLCHVLCCTVCQ